MEMRQCLELQHKKVPQELVADSAEPASPYLMTGNSIRLALSGVCQIR
jgi:hypothetical protein